MTFPAVYTVMAVTQGGNCCIISNVAGPTSSERQTQPQTPLDEGVPPDPPAPAPDTRLEAFTRREDIQTSIFAYFSLFGDHVEVIKAQVRPRRKYH